VLRIGREGGIPPDNPFAGVASARCNLTGRTDPGKDCRETFAWGLRNPFRFAFDPNASDTRFRINDVGQNTWEEVDEGAAGADYGWNTREGPCVRGSTSCATPPAGMTDPLYSYNHTSGCKAITGGAFVPAGAWPPAYDGAYLFGDYVCGKIFRLKGSAPGQYTAEEFATGLGVGSAVHLAIGPRGAGQALYYTTFAGTGEVRRIAFTGGGNRPPVAALDASPRAGSLPLEVTFDASASYDPDAASALAYTWDFGDGSPPRQTTVATVTHTYSMSGDFTASVTVADPQGAVSAPATATVAAGDSPPVPTIQSPVPAQRFAVGETVTLRGSATDAEDGVLSDGSLSWRAVLHHNEHTHPFLPTTPGNGITLTAPAPEDLFATETSYLEVFLTATDSRGIKTTVSQAFRPKQVPVSFATDPPGLRVSVNGTSYQTPVTVTSWEAYELDVDAPAQSGYAFSSWSDGGAAAHRIKTPPAAATYTASFRPNSSAYRDAVLGTVGLVSYWRLGERSGTTAVDLKSGRNGTYAGAALGRPGAIAGDPDTAAGFDGNDDYVSIPDFPPPANLTIEAWIFPQDTVPGADRIIVDKSNSEYDLRISPEGYLLFATGATVVAAVDDTFNYDNFANTGRYYHVAVTFDAAGDTVRFYRNGTLTKTITGYTPAIQNTTYPLRIGRHSRHNFATFNGRLDEVAIYNTPLPATTIQDHYTAGTG
jgi:hypothetical protein